MSKRTMNTLTKEYMTKPYTRMVNPISDESGDYFVGRILEFDGCMTTGNTAAEVYELLEDAMEGWIEVKLEHGDPIPDPISVDGYSGKFVMRIPKSLHSKLALEAKLEGVSLNQYALYKLSR